MVARRWPDIPRTWRGAVGPSLDFFSRVLGMIGGERAGDRQNVQERLEQLDDNTLARLLALLESEKKGGASNQS